MYNIVDMWLNYHSSKSSLEDGTADQNIHLYFILVTYYVLLYFVIACSAGIIVLVSIVPGNPGRQSTSMVLLLQVHVVILVLAA